MRSFEINPDHLMSEVYSYPFPEVRRTIDRLRLDARFMLNTLDVESAAELLAPYEFEPRLELPAGADGSLNLDELHVPVIERIRRTVGASLISLDGFEHAYPTPGSSQAMFTLLSEWHARGELDSIATLKGEYEGYAAYADSLHIPVTHHETLTDSPPKPGEVWFVSNPSAVDGNWIDHDSWRQFTEAGHRIVYDAAYVGLTDAATLDVSSPHIKAVLTSPSKIFGVFRYRNTGITYTREPVKSMYGTRWFKDVPALLDTLKLYESFGRNELPRAYRPVQRTICDALSELACAEIIPSDVLLLASTAANLDDNFSTFIRANVHRFGLTKLFEDYERGVAS